MMRTYSFFPRAPADPTFLFKEPAKKAQREKQFEAAREDMLALAKTVVIKHGKPIWAEVFSHYFNENE